MTLEAAATLERPTYRERPARVPGCVVWSRPTPVATRHRILPDGCLDLIVVGGQLLVAGPDLVAQLTESAPGDDYVGLRMASGVGPAVLGVPAAELVGQRVPLASIWPAATVRRLTDRLASGDPATVLEAIVAERLDARPPDPVMRAAARQALSGRPVAAIAAELGLSARHLHRRCQISFGYGLKTLARIGRLDRALALARAGLPLSRVAADAGYADQPHFTREVRALAGVPPVELLAGT